MITRRTLIVTLGGGLLALHQAASSQPARKVHRIGILSSGTANPGGPQTRDTTLLAALLRGLSERGYVQGQHFAIESRSDDGRPDRLPGLAGELVRLQVDVILAGGRQPLAALKQVTSTIPVVMTAAIDPVGEGLVRSLGHPGANFTELSLQFTEMTGKRLELLRELAAPAAPIAVLWSRAPADWRAAEAAAQARSWKLLSIDASGPDDLEGAFKAATRAHAGAMLVLGGGVFFAHARRIAELAVASRLPTMFGLRPYVEAGGLMSYGARLDDIWYRAAAYVDKILEGAKPADLPVEQPTRFELVINLKTAKALGLTIPQSLLLRADEVIER
jgi:putative ABC transport system substrate-binding protein